MLGGEVPVAFYTAIDMVLLIMDIVILIAKERNGIVRRQKTLHHYSELRRDALFI